MVNDGDFRARVVEVIFVISNGQQRIDHRDHRSDTRRAKPRPHKLRTIRQHHQHTILEVRTKLAQRVAGAIRESCYISIRPLSIFVVKTDLILPTFLEIVIEEVVGHVEPFWERWIHSESSLEAVSTTCGSGWVREPLRTHPLPQVVLTVSNCGRPTLCFDPASEGFFRETLRALLRLPGCSS